MSHVQTYFWFERRFIRREERWREGEERSEGEDKSPLVESVGNLTSMLSQAQKLNLDDDWLNEYVSQASSRFNFCTWLSMEVRFPTDSTRGDLSSPSLRSSPSLHRSSLLTNRLWNQGSSNYENNKETMTTDLTTNYEAESITVVEKIKNLREQNFEG